jgi:hypothetical protein
MAFIKFSLKEAEKISVVQIFGPERAESEWEDLYMQKH